MASEPKSKKSKEKNDGDQPRVLPPLPDIVIDEAFKTELLERALKRAYLALEGHDDFKISMADLIRLLEAHSAMRNETTREVVVRWVTDDAGTEDGNVERTSPRKDPGE